MKIKRIFRKITSLILAAGMILSAASVKGVCVQAAENELLAHYPLTSDVKDISGNHRDAKVPSGAAGVTFSGHALTLAGGSSSSKNYVELPEGLFDGQNTVTVSMWIKNNNTKKNTAAFSFCGQTMMGTSPKYYFLLNPSNPDGYYKAVFTDPVVGSSANPWTTEVGVNNSNNNSISTSNRMNEWMYYTVTISEDKIVGYLDGELLGSGAISNMTVSDFGTDITAYLGKSEYPDELFAGSFRDLRIYGKVLSASEVSDLYEEAQEQFSVTDAIASLGLKDGAVVYSDLELPTKLSGCTVTWESSNPSLIETNGTVHYAEKNTEVTLTALIKKGAVSEEVHFVLVVPTEAEGKSRQYRLGLLIPRYISEDLQSEVNGEKITWSCDVKGIVTSDGKVTLPKQDTDVTLVATIGDAEVTKNVTVMSDGGQILTYVIEGGNMLLNTGDLLAIDDSRRSDALFMAAKMSNESEYQELNKGKAVTYVEWSGDQVSNPNNQMGSPILFRYADGSLGAAASGNNARNGIYVWETTENMLFTGERFLTLASDETVVKNPVVVYDEMASAYKVFWEDGNGSTYVSLLDSLSSGITPSETEKTVYEKTAVSGTLPDNAVRDESSVFMASKEEYEAITRKYANVHNIGIEDVEISVETDGEIQLPETVTAEYSDGSTKNLGIVWDEDTLDKINTSVPGTYKITGSVQQSAYNYPFIEERADPHVFYNEDDGYYYSTGSYYEANMTTPNVAQSYRKLDIRRSKTIAGLKNAKEHYILSSEIGDRWGGFFWAPEFHKINGTWYCLVGAHDFGAGGITANQNWNNWYWCSASILIPYEGTDEQMQAGGMLDPEQWGEPIILEMPSGASASFDISYFEDDDGQGYYIVPTAATLRIVKVQSGDGVIPHGVGEVVTLKGGQWPWEYGIYEGSVTASNPKGSDQLVVEGPYLFEYGDKYYISYSAATVDKYYALGLMMADKGSDLMDPDSWTHISYPLLSSYDTYKGQIGNGAHVGGGHNSIVLDEYGNLVLAYHARPYPDPHTGMSGVGGLVDPCRHTVVKSIHVAYDGTLIFNMTAEEELDPSFKTVTATIEVGKEPLPYEDIEETNWFYDGVAYTYYEGLMSGIDPTHFGPYDGLSRAQFALILYRMEGKPEVSTEKSFFDVAEDDWYGSAVLWAAEEGIVTGYLDGCFGPADLITREQMAVMMYRYADSCGKTVDTAGSYDGFQDGTAVSPFAEKAMRWAVGNHIITGKENGTVIDPQGNTARSEAAIIIQRFMVL